MDDISKTAAALSAATSGPNTPDAMTVKRAPKEAVWTIFAALGAVWTLGLFIAGIIAFARWPEAVAEPRVRYLGFALIGALFCIGVLVIAVASSRLGRVEASAGSIASVKIDGAGE